MDAPSSGVWRVGGGNLDVNNPRKRRAVRIARNTQSHSWGWSEAGTAQRYTASVRGYHTLNSMGFDNPRDADDCTMHVRKNLDVEHFSMTKVCDDLGDSKIGHGRVFSMLAYKAPFFDGRTVCHIAIHPNWVQGLSSTSHPVVEEFVESMKHLQHMLRFATRMRWVKAVTGDFNLLASTEKDFLTPYDVFEQFGMTYRTERLDGVAWDEVLSLVGWNRIPKRVTRSDHPFWTVADLRLKGRG